LGQWENVLNFSGEHIFKGLVCFFVFSSYTVLRICEVLQCIVSPTDLIEITNCRCRCVHSKYMYCQDHGAILTA
jgi:hypothetical protein